MSVAGRSLPIPTDVVTAAARIRDWARMAARSFGTYAGINQAIKEAPDRSLPAVHMGDLVRNEMTTLTAIRVHALLDRDAEVSLQSVNRFLKQIDAFDQILFAYAGGDPPEYRDLAKRTCRTAIDKFLAEYARIDWSAFGKLQAYRNGAIAHISIAEVQAAVTYAQLEDLVRSSARLSNQLSLMTSGLNCDAEEDLRDSHDDSWRFWGGIFRTAANDTVGSWIGREVP